jgi:Homeodomain-like domain
MIHMPPKRIARAIERAAQLRATGMGYLEIARELGRPVNTVRNWSYTYRDHWNQLMATHQQGVTTDAYSEALASLRVLLRSDDERIRRDAAKAILDTTGPIQPVPDQPPITDLHRFADYLEGLSDEDLLALLGAKDTRDLTGPDGGVGTAGAATGAG